MVEALEAHYKGIGCNILREDEWKLRTCLPASHFLAWGLNI